jgi:hypothetical protein
MKPGIKTSEFWITFGSNVVAALFASGVIPTTGETAKILGVVGPIATAIGYAISRGLAKQGQGTPNA